MIHEYYSQCLHLKVYIDNQENTVTIDYLNGDKETHGISAEDAGLIIESMNVPSFSWGSVMLQIGRAIERAIGSGSSSE